MSLFTACSDDDPDYTPVIEEEIAGNYKGVLGVSINGQQVAQNIPQRISVSGAGATSINLSLTNFSFSGIQVGDVALQNCPMTQNGNTYDFTGATNLNITGLTASVNATGNIGNGTVSITMDIDATLGTVEQTVVVTYTGTKLTGSESSEAQIKSFVFDRNVAAVDSLVLSTTIDEANKTISISVADTAKSEYLSQLVPTIEISTGATVTPNSGVAQDFNKAITYTVVAEDGTVAKYVVSVASKMRAFDFENWTAEVEGQTPEMTYYEPTGWSSSNAGAHMLKGFGMADSYVVMETEDAHSGEKAALIKSIDTKGMDMFIAKVPKVTTGSLFLGNFITELSSTLRSTKFGIPYTQKPVSLKGWYKYTPGAEYYSVTETPYEQHCHQAVLDETKSDEFMISVVLYETEEYDVEGWSDCLTGSAVAEENIYNSSRVAAIAQLTGGEQAEWTSFELPLEWKKEYNAETKYRLAIVCSASKDGDKFSGAPGSTLIVDDFELTVE